MPRKKNNRNSSQDVIQTIEDDAVDAIFIDTAQDLISYKLLSLDGADEIISIKNRQNRQLEQSDFENNGQWNKYIGAVEDLQEVLLDLEKYEGEIAAGTIG